MKLGFLAPVIIVWKNKKKDYEVDKLRIMGAERRTRWQKKMEEKFDNLEEKKIKELEAICDDLGIDTAKFDNKGDYVKAIKTRLADKTQ